MRGIGWLLLALACGQPPPADQAMTHDDQAGVFLGAGILEVALPIALDSVPTAPAVVAIQVDRVQNPDRRPVDLALALRLGAEPPIPLGAVALFPVDSGGRFSLRLPAEALVALDRARRERLPVVLAVTLARDSTTATDRRSLRVGAATFVATGDNRPR